MNAKEKAKILRENGYNYGTSTKTGRKSYAWWLSRNPLKTIVSNYSFAESTHAAYQHYLDNQTPTETQASEAPAAPQTLIDYGNNFDDWNSITASLPYTAAPQVEAEIDDLKTQIVGLADKWIVEEQKNETLENRIAKLEADNAALRNENARMKESLKKAVAAMLLVGANMNIDEAQRQFDFHAKKAAKDSTPTPPAQEVAAPKFTVGQVVTIIVHIDKLSGIVIERKLEDNQWHYKVERPFTGITMWYTESELS